LRDVVLKEGLQRISKGAFLECTSLESITFPSTLTQIDQFAFGVCKSLREVDFHEGLQKIGRGTFVRCFSLQNVTLPTTLTEIERGTFHACSDLKDVILKEGLQKIGLYAFRCCSSLRSINLPSTLIDIDQFAFAECTSLREVAVPEGIQKISSNAFNGCLELERLSFPSLTTRLNNIIRAGQTEIRNKIDSARFGGGAWVLRNGELFIPRSALRDWEAIRQNLDRIDEVITYYEIKEATTLFELALWKAKLNQAEQAADIDREAHRIDVPGPVKDTILQYLR